MNIRTALAKLETSVNSLRQTAPPSQMETIDKALFTVKNALTGSTPIPHVWFLIKTDSAWEGVDYYIFQTSEEAEEKMKADYKETLANCDDDSDIEAYIDHDSAKFTTWFTDECCYDKCDEETTSWNIFEVSLNDRLPASIRDKMLYTPETD